MTDNEKLFLFDFETKVDTFIKKTSFEIREDDYRRAYNETDK